jgi:hypothetical protein
MRFSLARTALGFAILAAFAAYCSAAQDTSSAPAPQQPADQTTHGQVIFSRSANAPDQTQTQPAPAPPEMLKAPIADDVERQAVTFTAFDLDVHLRLAEQAIAVRALITVRNDGKSQLARIPLQISSSLNWERIRLLGRDVPIQVATLNSDADHTGQLHEVAVPLPNALAPGGSLQLDVTYSGKIALSAQRLLAIGAPKDVALHSDWDEISGPFTGLRGFGNVVWYPVSSVPVIMGDGARLFDEMGEHKLHMSGARFRMRLEMEFPRGQAPNIAVINGHALPLAVTNADAAGPEVPGVATASIEESTLGFEAPSIFIAARHSHTAGEATLWTLPIDDPAVESWTAASTMVTPFLQGWLGQKPRSELTILDLPDPDDAPFETGSMLATSIREDPPEQLQDVMVHAMTHAWMESPRAWLSEGVAHFMGTLWVEKERGRTRALEGLEANRQALALAEPSSPGVSSGQPLTAAISPIYYRAKATYVLWMLRDLAGDGALSAAFRAYDPTADTGNSNSQGTDNFDKLLERYAQGRNLAWFFADWVDADKGLPDLTIDSVFPAAAQAGNWLVAVNISNSGYAAAEIPVTVRSDTNAVTERVFVPGHGKAVQRILILGKPTSVQINDGTVPETEASVHVTNIVNTKDDSSGTGNP